MLYLPKCIDYKLPNGELIGGYLAFKGNVKEIEKYKDQELLKNIHIKGHFLYLLFPLEEVYCHNYKKMMESIKVLINALFFVKIQIIIILKGVDVTEVIVIDAILVIIII